MNEFKHWPNRGIAVELSSSLAGVSIQRLFLPAVAAAALSHVMRPAQYH